MSTRLSILTVACLALFVGCADTETENVQAGEEALTDNACAPSAPDARQVKEVADDVHAAVEAEAAAEGYVPDPSAPAESPEVDRASGAVKAMEGDDQHTVTLALPGTGCGTAASRPDSSLTVFTSEQLAFSTAVAGDTEGAFRALVHIESAAAPTEYAFTLDLPEGGQLVPLEDGGAVVSNAAGDILATFTPPWATDAHGVEVPTHYEIRGNTLIQHLELSPALTYPVVADPFWIPALMVMGHIGRHAATQMARRKISEALVRRVILNGARSRGNQAGTSVFTQGKGANKIRVIVNDRTGKVITVTKG
jgi:hypothetical protein